MRDRRGARPGGRHGQAAAARGRAPPSPGADAGQRHRREGGHDAVRRPGLGRRSSCTSTASSSGAERDAFERHLAGARICRDALDELAHDPRGAGRRPACRPRAGGDWSAFMSRLDRAIARRAGTRSRVSAVTGAAGRRRAPAVRRLSRDGGAAGARDDQRGGRDCVRGTSLSQSHGRTRLEVADPARSPRTRPTERAGVRGVERGALRAIEAGGARPGDEGCRARARRRDWAYERELASSLLERHAAVPAGGRRARADGRSPA